MVLSYVHDRRQSIQAILASRVEDFMRRELTNREGTHRIGNDPSTKHNREKRIIGKFSVRFLDETLEVPVTEGVHAYVLHWDMEFLGVCICTLSLRFHKIEVKCL